MARFLIDESLPSLLTSELVKEGHEAAHVYDVGLQGAPDEEVHRRAGSMGAVLLTRDLGFADVRRFPGRTGIAVVRIRGRVRMRELTRQTVALLGELAHAIEELEGKIVTLEPGRSRLRNKLQS